MAIFPSIREIRETIGIQESREIDIPETYTVKKTDDYQFMARAIRLAEKGIFTTHPNPRVGAVVTNNGVVVGEGYHQFAGGPHAEVHALKQAGKYAKGGTLYINLEPCSHHGRTPPCSTEVVKAGIARVVIAMEDPNPQVNSGGIAALQEAGVHVEVGINRQQAITLNRGFIKRMSTGKPWVTLKIAASLDGKTAMANGESQWITSPAARQDAHRIRAASSAILTGVGTVLRDDPKMTPRLPEVVRQPLRVILDTRLSTPTNAQILTQPGDVLIITSANQIRDKDLYARDNVTVISCGSSNDAIDLPNVMVELGKREINNVMLEAGARLSGRMLQNQLVDEIVTYMSPDILGSAARGMFEIPGLEHIDDKVKFEFHDIRKVGRDMRLTMLAA